MVESRSSAADKASERRALEPIQEMLKDCGLLRPLILTERNEVIAEVERKPSPGALNEAGRVVNLVIRRRKLSDKN